MSIYFDERVKFVSVCLDAEYRIDDQHNPILEENWNEQSKDVRRYVRMGKKLNTT